MDWNLSTAARTLWQEARGEPIEGKRAVAHALINRRNAGRWGDTLGSVCLARSQFSAWGPVVPSDKNMLANFRASCALSDDDLDVLASLIVAAENEPDPTNGATHYYNPKAANPDWVKTATPCGKFGNHLFFKNIP